MNCTWTEAEKLFIKQHADKIKDSDMAIQLSQRTGRKVTLQALRKQRRKLGIVKARGRGFCQIIDKSVKISEKVRATSEEIDRIFTKNEIITDNCDDI